MTYEQRNNSGTLGRNKNKEKESHPDHRGSCVIKGEEYWISAWIKRNGATGEKFFSLSFQPKEDNSNRGDNQHESPEYDDDVPF